LDGVILDAKHDGSLDENIPFKVVQALALGAEGFDFHELFVQVELGFQDAMGSAAKDCVFLILEIFR
jgi:hypothetical protein